jgi:predicted secreted protein
MKSIGTGGFVLAADLAGSGVFAGIGTMSEPGPEFAASIRELRSEDAKIELREVLIYAAAAAPAGNCVFDNKQAEKALRDCFEAQLISEWRITFPALGKLQALYIVKRLYAADARGCCRLELLLAGKPAFHFFPPPKAESP